ncbi:MAG: Mov34/MPN/PAD-1 family protein [Candidatus Aenigmarchaeota archaeon]|nr:Mov34/MPN/PAD-1 family protein [Candidatus Aenigmarchaeota archaeon]
MPSRRNLTISEQALVQMVTSSIEVYKKEAIGLILGQKHKKHYLAKDAINFQSAKRGYVSVDVPQARINRLNYVLGRLTDSRVIGDFHSHPDFPETLSSTDKEDLKVSGLTLTVLTVVRKAGRKGHDWHIKDKALSGFVGNRYHVKLLAFEYDKKAGKFFRIKIVCPHLKKLNRL